MSLIDSKGYLLLYLKLKFVPLLVAIEKQQSHNGQSESKEDNRAAHNR